MEYIKIKEEMGNQTAPSGFNKMETAEDKLKKNNFMSQGTSSVKKEAPLTYEQKQLLELEKQQNML